MEAKEILISCSIFSALIPLAAGFANRRALLWYYPVAGLFFDLLIHVNKDLHFVSHSILLNGFLLTEYIIVTGVFSHYLYRNFRILRIYNIVNIFIFTVTLFFWRAHNLNGFGAIFFSFSFIIHSLAGFYLIIKEQKILFLFNSSFFWLNVTFLIYASGSFLFFLFWEYLVVSHLPMLTDLWKVFCCLNILKNILLSFALFFLTQVDGEPA